MREVFTLTLREAQHQRNTCLQYIVNNILHQRGLPCTVGTRIWNHLQLLLPHRRHVVQTNNRYKKAGPIAILHTDAGRGPTGEAIILDQVDPTSRESNAQPNVSPPASGHPSCRLPPAPRLAQQIGFGNPPTYGSHHSRPPAARRWGDPRRIQSVLEHSQAVPTTEPPQQKPGPPPTAGTAGVRSRGHNTGSPPTGAQRPQRQLVDASPAHGTQVPPTTVTTRPTDGHTHHVLAMRAPSTGNAMAHPPTVGTTPPQVDVPRYSRSTSVVAHALRAGPSGRDSHGDMEARHHGGEAY